jgi:uncharacterized protein
MLVRVHIDHENQAAIDQFLEEYREAFGTDPRFLLFLRPLSRLGGPRDNELPTFAVEEGMVAADEARRRARERGLALYSPDEEPLVCYAARANSFVVRSNGSLGKCTIALSHDENHVGQLREDGRVELNDDKIGRWIRGLWSGDPEELGCPMRGYADVGSPGDPRPIIRWQRRPDELLPH